MDAAAEFFIVGFMVVLTFVAKRPHLLGECVLGLALGLDGLVCLFNGVYHFSFAHLLHFTFNHDNAVKGACHHNVHVSDFQFGAQRVDDEFSIHATYTHFRHGAIEGDVRDCDCRTGCETSQAVRENLLVGAHQLNHDLCPSVVVTWEQWSQSTIDKAHHQHFRVGGTCFALKETPWETASGGILLSVIHGEWKEVNVHGFVAGHDGGQKHGVARANNN